MAESQNIDSILSKHVPIERDVARCAERNEEFSQPFNLIGGPPQFWRRFQKAKMSLNRLRGTLGHMRRFSRQKAPASFEATHRTCGHDYSWHGGSACSFSAPQFSSH